MNTSTERERLSQVISKLIKDAFGQSHKEDEDVHKEMVVIFTRAIWGLLFTMSDSLNDVGDKTSILINEEGVFREGFLKAISHRVGCDIDFQEFTAPLAECFHREACVGNLFSARWKLIAGNGKSVYLESTEKSPPLLPNEKWTKAKVL